MDHIHILIRLQIALLICRQIDELKKELEVAKIESLIQDQES
jgi:hypothetical protein